MSEIQSDGDAKPHDRDVESEALDDAGVGSLAKREFRELNEETLGRLRATRHS